MQRRHTSTSLHGVTSQKIGSPYSLHLAEFKYHE